MPCMPACDTPIKIKGEKIFKNKNVVHWPVWYITSAKKKIFNEAIIFYSSVFSLDGTVFLIYIHFLQFNFFLTRPQLQPYGSDFPYFVRESKDCSNSIFFLLVLK